MKKAAKSGSRVLHAGILILAALLLPLSSPAEALLEPGTEELSESTTPECFDAEGVRAGGFIWSDGRPPETPGE